MLLLGSPLMSVTSLHYADCLADVPDKRIVRYRMPVLIEGQKRWVEVEEFDASDGIRDWGGGDYFEEIVREYLEARHGRSGLVGAAKSFLFDARSWSKFGVEWMEREFSSPTK